LPLLLILDGVFDELFAFLHHQRPPPQVSFNIRIRALIRDP
jgi:hypothetical protein